MGYPIQGSKSSLFAEMDFFLVCTYVGCVCLGSVLIIYLSDLSSCHVCKPLCLHYLHILLPQHAPSHHPLTPIFSSLPSPLPHLSSFSMLTLSLHSPFLLPSSSLSQWFYGVYMTKGYSYLSMIVASFNCLSNRHGSL